MSAWASAGAVPSGEQGSCTPVQGPDALPEALQEEICRSYLTLHSLAVASAVCRRWRALSKVTFLSLPPAPELSQHLCFSAPFVHWL
jgi:hypothetical protein